MAQAVVETTTATVIPWKRQTQDVPRVLLGNGPEVPRRLMPRKKHDAALAGVHALIQGLRAGQAELARQGWEGKAARRAARAERRQETRTKMAAFAIYYLLAAVMCGTMYAAAHG